VIEPSKQPETDLVQPTKREDTPLKKRDYNVSEKVLAKNSDAGLASANARRSRIQDKMSEKLDIIVNSMTPEEITDASFKDKGTVAGILYDKLYRDQRQLPQTAVQINIQTMGQDPTKVEPLMINVTPNKETTDNV
jgi:hypothetical protein